MRRELAERAARAMDQGEWNRAAAYLDEFASRSPRSAQLATMRKELASRWAPEMPVWPPDGPADHGDVPRPAAPVAILEAAATSAFAKPGIGCSLRRSPSRLGPLRGAIRSSTAETENGRDSARSQFSVVSH